MPDTTQVRRMEEEDLDFILELGDETPELWMDEDIKFLFDEEALLDWSHSSDKRGYVFEESDEKIGFGLISVDGKMAEIVAYVIKEGFRGEGRGRGNFKKILQDLEEDGIEVEMVYTGVENDKVIEFYSEFGFKKGKELLMMYRGLG